MSITVSSNITYPIPGQVLRLTLTPTTGNYAKVYATAAPPGSKIQADIDKESSGCHLIYEGFTTEPWETQFDVSGLYVLSIDEFSKGAASYGGGYKGSPDAAPTETRIGTTAYSMSIGRRLTTRVGTSKDSATLVLYVWDSTVRATTLSVHGEATPALIDPTTPKAKNAAQVTGIVAALAALAGVAAGTLAGNPVTVFSDIAAQHNGHVADAGHHASADSDNVLDASYLSTPTLARLSEPLAELRRCQDRHMRNDSGTGTGSASSVYHTVADWINLPIADPPSDAASNAIAVADCWRAHEAHRMQLGGVHSVADTSHDCDPLPALLELHRLVLVELAKTTPTAVSTEHPGALTLTTLMGMKV